MLVILMYDSDFYLFITLVFAYVFSFAFCYLTSASCVVVYYVEMRCTLYKIV